MNRFSATDMAAELEVLRSTIKWPNLQPSNNIDTIMKGLSSFSELEKLDPGTLNAYSVSLAYYSFYIAEQTQRLEAKVAWFEANIKALVGERLKDVTNIFAFNEKDLFIRSNDPTVRGLDDQRVAEMVKLTTLKFMGQKISFLSERVENLARTKSNQMRYTS